MKLKNKKSFFKIPVGVTYLNSASYSPLTKTAYESGLQGLRRKREPWNMDERTPKRETEKLRMLFGSLIGAIADDIAIVNSTSYGIETAAKNLSVKKNHKIILLENQFPSNVLSWINRSNDTREKIVFLQRPYNYDWTSMILENLDRSVSIAALPPFHWFDGCLIDLVKIGKRCRELNIALVVDATQAIGAVPFHIDKIKPDFLACSAYKWLLCPYTLAFLYVSPRYQSGTPLEYHRWNHSNPSATITNYTYTEKFNVGARRYDMGQVNNLINLPIAISALKQVINWKPKRIQEYLSPLIFEIGICAEELGWSVVPEKYRAHHFIGIAPKTPLQKDFNLLLQKEKVFVSHRGDGLRVSPYLFNDVDDIKVFFNAIKKLS